LKLETKPSFVVLDGAILRLCAPYVVCR